VPFQWYFGRENLNVWTHSTIMNYKLQFSIAELLNATEFN
jgi:hypothetical protein